MNAHDKVSRFENQEELGEDEWDEYTEAIRNLYSAYVLEIEDRVSYSLWYDEGEYEYEVLSSSSLGNPEFKSRDKDVGEPTELSEYFFTALGYVFHEQMVFTPPAYTPEQAEETMNVFYDDDIPDHENWFIWTLTTRFAGPSDNFPRELVPLARYCGRHTEFSVPALTTSLDDVGDDSQ